jgi:hypothetical protein
VFGVSLKPDAHGDFADYDIISRLAITFRKKPPQGNFSQAGQKLRSML